MDRTIVSTVHAAVSCALTSATLLTNPMLWVNLNPIDEQTPFGDVRCRDAAHAHSIFDIR